MNKLESPQANRNFWKHFQKQKAAFFAFWIVISLVIIAIFADVLANDKPLLASYQHKLYFPVWHQYSEALGAAKKPYPDWKTIKTDFAIWPPVRYAAKEIDLNNAQYCAPGAKQNIKNNRYKHYMGTDALGKDVLSALIHGTRIALCVGLGSMIIAGILGISLGMLAGFFGDYKLKISKASIWGLCFFIIPGFFYGFQCRQFQIIDAMHHSFLAMIQELILSLLIFLMILVLGYYISKALKVLVYFRKKINFPLDMIISKMIEVFTAVPKLFLILSVVVLIKPSLLLIICIIGFFSWTEMARLVRAEMLVIREKEYMESANALGYPTLRQMFYHALPNALGPVFISISFGIAAAILTESSLSFLGIGLPIDTLSWGKLLSSAREAPQAWWLAVFPGFAIFICVTAFNLIGDGLTKVMEARKE